jgi:hypothetical protein
LFFTFFSIKITIFCRSEKEQRKTAPKIEPIGSCTQVAPPEHLVLISSERKKKPKKQKFKTYVLHREDTNFHQNNRHLIAYYHHLDPQK